MSTPTYAACPFVVLRGSRSLSLLGIILALMLPALGRTQPTATPLANVIVKAVSGVNANASAFDGVVEAVHQTVVAAQVSGAIVALNVRSGDRVASGQLLARIDARAAIQGVAAGDAQVRAARASLDVAARQFERQQQLYQKNYISQAALERAESEFKAAQAQWAAQGAQANAVRTESGFYAIRAPFAGIVSDLPVSVGDMAMPGRSILTLYDPSTLRVTAALPQSVAAQLHSSAMPRIEIPALPDEQRWVPASEMQVLPTVDATTHTTQVRVNLPPRMPGTTPGMFARLWIPTQAMTSAADSGSVAVPVSSVVRRAELTALYVLTSTGQPLLRQVRLGHQSGDHIEVLSGLAPGERVATDPQAAARVR